MRIYLTGFMGAGKTTVGRLLAERLNLPLIDLDQEIEQRTGKTISTLFEEGEARFRDQERACLESHAAGEFVMATGGGCFIFNAGTMLQTGTVIFLDVPFETLVKRVGADPARPLWRNAEKLFQERHQLYKKAHFTVNASGSAEETAERIVAMLE